MKIELKQRNASHYLGFSLSKICELNSYCSVIIGKNGCGKTRLFNSIMQGNITLSINGRDIERNEISFITELEIKNTLSGYDIKERVDKLSEEILKHENRNKKLPYPSDVISFNLDSPSTPLVFNLKNIEENLEKITKKKISDSYKEELCLSIALHNDFLSLTKETLSFGQVIQKHYYCVYINSLLKAMNNIHGDCFYFDDDDLKKILGPDPIDLINETISSHFNGKFLFKKANKNARHLAKDTLLYLTENEESISLEYLSSGEKVMFWFCIAIVESLYSLTQNIPKEKAVILIDEPDSRLHPQMIKLMYEIFSTLNKKASTSFIITSHSPTTVALHPTEDIYILDENESCLNKTNIDRAISSLLDGVNHISISPKNRKFVYVENESDADIYRALFSKFENRLGVELSFVTPGVKYNDTALRHALNHYVGESKNELIDNIIKKANSCGNCKQVISIVQDLRKKMITNVRGIIDWDNKNNNDDDYIIVSGYGTFYSLENIIFDPVNLYVFLTTQLRKKYPVNDFIQSTNLQYAMDAIDNDQLLQEAVFSIVKIVLSSDDEIELDTINNYDNLLTITYSNSEKKFMADKRYFNPALIGAGKNGHYLEVLIKKSFPELNHYSSPKTGGLMPDLVNKVMIEQLRGQYIPHVIHETFLKLQS
ncbi:ATP-binding protein [Pectobacterium polaris]|uniref:ATP-binding protein n=1 Tax=Pectobacterium polaris TaxID=2042057 RepID=UPI000F8CAFF0|nr:ATP-binding protein [Pectobacterium polaris]RUR97693.1 hypothetical protein KHDHEBDM_02025 [Pectobacterium polaris]